MEHLTIEYLPVKALKPYEKNTRKHADLDVKNIAKSIEKYGFNDAIGIWGDDNVVVEGHGRLLAAKKLCMNEVPCVRLDHLTDEQRREYAITHNATAELSTFDFEILGEELLELDLSDFDFELESNESGLVDYMGSDSFTNPDSNPKQFAVTLNFDIGYKQAIEEYLRENGKDELVATCMEVMCGA